jgi:hypothetical protein
MDQGAGRVEDALVVDHSQRPRRAGIVRRTPRPWIVAADSRTARQSSGNVIDGRVADTTVDRSNGRALRTAGLSARWRVNVLHT